MKRLFYIFVSVALVLILFFQYDSYRRFHPPSEYQYPVSDSIDINYHDPSILLEYYSTAELCGTFARACWRNHKIDVKRSSPNDPEASSKVQQYALYLSKARFLEQKLIQSSIWKREGLNNEEIKLIEISGANPSMHRIHQWLQDSKGLENNDHGAAVYELQRLLAAQGQSLPIDGYFAQETERAVKDFQTSEGLYPTGIADDLTLLHLFKLSDTIQPLVKPYRNF